MTSTFPMPPDRAELLLSDIAAGPVDPNQWVQWTATANATFAERNGELVRLLLECGAPLDCGQLYRCDQSYSASELAERVEVLYPASRGTLIGLVDEAIAHRDRLALKAELEAVIHGGAATAPTTTTTTTNAAAPRRRRLSL